jgi:hypothetical protein
MPDAESHPHRRRHQQPRQGRRAFRSPALQESALRTLRKREAGSRPRLERSLVRLLELSLRNRSSSRISNNSSNRHRNSNSNNQSRSRRLIRFRHRGLNRR